MEHNSVLFTFTKEAATTLYKTLLISIQEKIDTKSYRAIPSDMKDALDHISESKCLYSEKETKLTTCPSVFQEPPYENRFISYNRDLISAYLKSDIKPFPMTKAMSLPALKPCLSGLSGVFTTLSLLSPLTTYLNFSF